MESTMKYFIVFGVLTVFISAAEGMECYSCNDCNDVSNAQKVSCSGVCFKISVESGDHKGTYRTCSPIKMDTGCAEYSYLGVTANRCICDGNLCNGSPVTKMSLPVALFFAAVTAILYRQI